MFHDMDYALSLNYSDLIGHDVEIVISTSYIELQIETDSDGQLRMIL